MIYTAILAGGIGSRMNISDVPKQFLKILDKPIIIHTIEKFLLNLEIDKIYVGIHKEWVLYLNDLIEKYNLPGKKIFVVVGGDNRTNTLINVMNKIEEDNTITDEDIIITHDAVRPFVSNRIINDNIKSVKEHKACDTAVNATDTIVVCSENEMVLDVPQREHLYLGQTPQSFNFNLLKEVYKGMSKEEKENLTDSAKACIIKNVPVKIVKGAYSNIKITTVYDYKVAKIMVENDTILKEGEKKFD